MPPRGYESHPIDLPYGSARYEYLRRWLQRHTGPRIRTEPQLRRALTKPDVFYILPRKYR